jgi:hypothetical protein
MTDLNSMIDPTLGWMLTTANGINDAGQITGTGILNGEAHAVLLTPTPEPGACGIMLLAALGLLSRRRKSSN